MVTVRVSVRNLIGKFHGFNSGNRPGGKVQGKCLYPQGRTTARAGTQSVSAVVPSCVTSQRTYSPLR